MHFLAACHTDAGIRKTINQDSLVLLQAQWGSEEVLFAAVCDGMGGLSQGEAASGTMAEAFAKWFEEDLPELLSGDISIEVPEKESGCPCVTDRLDFPEREAPSKRPDTRQIHAGTEEKYCLSRNPPAPALFSQWKKLLVETGQRIEAYGRRRGIELGTTAVGLLIIGDRYYILNVGDSRVYLLSDGIRQLTTDQTYVQREIDAGRMTPAQAREDPMRNMLLQCVGAGCAVCPEFREGKAEAGQAFLLCSDGFRHVLPEEEIFRELHPGKMTGEDILQQKLVEMTELVKRRQEKDNISAILIRLME